MVQEAMANATILDLYREIKEMRSELELFLSLVLPEEELTPEEKRSVAAAEKDIQAGRCVSLDQLLSERW